MEQLELMVKLDPMDLMDQPSETEDTAEIKVRGLSFDHESNDW